MAMFVTPGIHIRRMRAKLELYLSSSLQEFADALMDVKLAIEDVRKSKTLRQVLGTLLAIGNFLNGKEVRCGSRRKGSLCGKVR